MSNFTRRDVLKSGMAAPAASAMGLPLTAALAQSAQPQTAAGSPSPRERALLDFGWRFHYGHANDSSKDFGFGAGRIYGF